MTDGRERRRGHGQGRDTDRSDAVDTQALYVGR